MQASEPGLREPSPGGGERLVQCMPSLRAVDTLTVSEEKMLGLEPAESTPWRHEPKQGMHPQGLPPGTEVAHAPERVAADEDPLLREVERDLTPEARHAHGDHLEGGIRNAPERGHVQRDAEPPGDSSAIAAVPVEELNDPGRLAECPDPFLDFRPVESVGHPDSPRGENGVRRPLQELVLGQPAEPMVELVAEPELHRKRSRSAGSTSSRALPFPAGESPRTIATGTPAVLPLTSSAAEAISSATAITVERSSYPAGSV